MEAPKQSWLAESNLNSSSSLLVTFTNSDTVTQISTSDSDMYYDSTTCSFNTLLDGGGNTVKYTTKEGHIESSYSMFSGHLLRLIGSVIDGNSEGNGILTALTKSAPSDLRIYPNPFTNELNIDLENTTNLRSQLFSLSGQLIIDEPTTTLPTSELAEGVYILKVYRGEELIAVNKLVKK